MEKLSDLPPANDAEMSPQESDVMKKYFGGNGSNVDAKNKTPGWMDTIKLAFYAAILFVILANPWIDTLLCMVPYCGDNMIMLLAFKTLLFMILFVGMYKFVIA